MGIPVSEESKTVKFLLRRYLKVAVLSSRRVSQIFSQLLLASEKDSTQKRPIVSADDTDSAV